MTVGASTRDRALLVLRSRNHFYSELLLYYNSGTINIGKPKYIYCILIIDPSLVRFIKMSCR